MRIHEKLKFRSKIALPLGRARFFQKLLQHGHGFGILVRGQIAVRQIENPVDRFGLVGGEPFEDIARAI